jgi:hypothetical protein
MPGSLRPDILCPNDFYTYCCAWRELETQHNTQRRVNATHLFEA